ncbi:glycohydrolase toxin TNT-related protein [Aquimarina brevivitae]|uniref:Uncharacterized protein DUF4237 n=1 Tax=Aquimarina brevivitae TaxID=323412 RepID=A0A4Q7P107_9FLAO|nr:glycohydrolase toxin TNT-related protein [Aquimarina brevivitae]RZS93385.1 uncharacterized protein DUF4237 [Aquimarina brevivitae]
MFGKFLKKSNETKKEADFNKSKIDWHLNESILTFDTGKLFMHYYAPNQKVDKNNPAWQNQGVFFWENDEHFDKKSLPDDFLSMETKLFLIQSIPDYIQVAAGKAMPWFGKPGGGTKYFFKYEDNPITLEEAHHLKIMKYVDVITITPDNISILNDRDNYVFNLSDKVTYKDKEFYLNQQKVSIAELYHKSLLIVLKI